MSKIPGMSGIKRLYEWVLSWAESPYGPAALFVLSFVESSFFPIPPDPLLIALCLGARKRSLAFAGICTLASVLGGLFGYWIGQTLLVSMGMPILEFYGKVEDFDTLATHFREAGNSAVLIAAMTPIPYKLVTITAGATSMSLMPFTLASVVGRGARFGILAALIAWKGEAISSFIDTYFELLTVVFSVLLVGGFVVFKFLLH